MRPEIEAVLAGDARWCVVHGDCREVMASLPDGSVDHVITDPPYSEHTHTKSRAGARKTPLRDLFTSPGDLIVDPFCGSGSTGVAALRRGRRFIGMELDEAHAATAHKRLEAEGAGMSAADVEAGRAPLFGGAA